MQSIAIIEDAKKVYLELKVMFVSIPFEVIFARIESRGREAEDDPVFKVGGNVQEINKLCLVRILL